MDLGQLRQTFQRVDTDVRTRRASDAARFDQNVLCCVVSGLRDTCGPGSTKQSLKNNIPGIKLCMNSHAMINRCQAILRSVYGRWLSAAAGQAD